MITEQDLRAAIAECQGERNPNAETCKKLAAYYTILNNMYPDATEQAYSFESAPSVKETVDYYSETEFGQTVQGKSTADVLRLFDELAATIQVIQPRLYNGLMRKLNEI